MVSPDKKDKIETHSCRRDNREYKKLRRRRQGQRRLTNEFLGPFESITLFITVKTKKNLKELAVVVHVLETTQNLVISGC